MSDEALSSLILLRLQGLTQVQALATIRHYGSAVAALTDPHPADPHWNALLHDQSGLHAARECALREIEFCQEHRIEVIPYIASTTPCACAK